MTSNKNQPRKVALIEATQKVTQELKPKSLAIFYRKPLVDEEYPEVSDIDITAIWTQKEEMPERKKVETQMGKVFVDVLWVPVSKMLNTEEAATYKTLPHLLIESEPVYVESETLQSVIDNIKLKTYDKAVWETRIKHQLDFGDAAFEEAKKNLDFPSAALFFLQTAHANYIIALADCLKQSTMSLLTRPVNKFKRMIAEIDPNLEQLLKNNLLLNVAPLESLFALRKIYNSVSEKCVGKQLNGVSRRTQGHYTYTLSPLEIEYRETFAKAIIQNGDYANANFYLRFWAYSLSRCPVVLKEAEESKKPSFYIPLESLKASINSAAPEILDDMKTILGGEVTSQKINDSINGTIFFKQQIINQIQKTGIKTEKEEN